MDVNGARKDISIKYREATPLRGALLVFAVPREFDARFCLSGGCSVVDVAFQVPELGFRCSVPRETGTCTPIDLLSAIGKVRSTPAFQGQTPDEMYFGTGTQVPADLDAKKKEARTARMAANRARSCRVCREAAVG